MKLNTAFRHQVEKRCQWILLHRLSKPCFVQFFCRVHIYIFIQLSCEWARKWSGALQQIALIFSAIMARIISSRSGSGEQIYVLPISSTKEWILTTLALTSCPNPWHRLHILSPPPPQAVHRPFPLPSHLQRSVINERSTRDMPRN